MQSQITAYNELMLQRNRLKESSGEKNPVVQAADKNLEGMRATISGSMDNYMKTLRLRLDKAKAVENRLASSIQAVPKQEKMALSIMRQQSIKETLYTFLLNKREENALQLAITEANIRVVEEPFPHCHPQQDLHHCAGGQVRQAARRLSFRDGEPVPRRF